MNITIGKTEFFPGIGKIVNEGTGTTNPLAFRWYDETRLVAGKTMKDHLRFSMAYWHTMCGTGGDPFGPGTKTFPWEAPADLMERNRNRMDAAFEFMTKMGIPFWCFHDTDIAGDGSVGEIEVRLGRMVEYALAKQQESGVKLLWGTANVFSNPRYMNGASTDPEDIFIAHITAMDIFARALIIADKILKESDFLKLRQQRYASFDAASGKAFEAGRLSLEDLRHIALTEGEPKMTSGRQEMFEQLITRYL
jgi:xylose isomerase